MKYRRGLTRIYLVLWVIWVLVVLVGMPVYIVREAIDCVWVLHRNLFWVCFKPGTYASVYNQMLRLWPFVLGALVGVPVVLYGLVYGAIVTFRGTTRWVARGFKGDSSEAAQGEAIPRSPDGWIKRCVALGIVLVAVSIAYYFVIYLPRERTARLEMERQERLATEQRAQEKLELERWEKQAADQRERARLETQQRESELRQAEILARDARRTQMDSLLNSCLSAEFDAYQKQWRETCWQLGNPNNKCLLPKWIADELGKNLREGETRCARVYPPR